MRAGRGDAAGRNAGAGRGDRSSRNGKKNADRLRSLPVEAPAAAPSPRPLSPPRIFAYVDAVAHHGSIRKAAAALHIVSSALNRRILDLEDELGSPLFERLPRGVRPTAAGEIYLDYVRRSMRELEHVGAQIEGLRRLLRGRVRLAVAESVTGHMLPTAIARFQAQHPNVAFHVWIDGPKGISDALATDAADLILTHDALDRPQVSVIASVHQPLCALVAPGHPLAARESIALHDCISYPIALPDSTLAARALIDRALMRASFKLEPALVSNSVELTKTFARQNQAVCFQFRIAGRPDPSGMVAIRLTDSGFDQATLALAARRHRVLPVASAAFASLLEEVFETL
ncbi:MAG TPA: LysR family transcriptional regulator [Polyangiaceae bacterium]|nr:LysR family transcriptional regulator [Polyangiaceae bacterium]